MTASVDSQGESPNTRIGYLLKHVHERWLTEHRTALEPVGINGRQLGVMMALAAASSPSQQDAADHLGIDRTTMVALIDELEALALVARQVDSADRRRNVVGLTARGNRVLTEGLAASDGAEARFLAPLDPSERRAWRTGLEKLAEAGTK